MGRVFAVGGLALVVVVGCSSSDTVPSPASGPSDAALAEPTSTDSAVVSDHTDAPVDLDACMRVRVWTASSTGFTLHEDAGPPSAPSGDAGCSEGGVTYGLSLASKTLSERKCAGAAIVESKLALSAVPSDLLALLTPLQTTCAPGCSTTPLLDLHLVVDDSDAGRHTFDSSAYASCADSSAKGPVIRYADLLSLRIRIADLLAGCADGGPPEGGMCTATGGDGAP